MWVARAAAGAREGFVCLLAGLSFVACTTTDGRVRTLSSRALRCPAERIALQHEARGGIVASGCGSTRRYLCTDIAGARAGCVEQEAPSPSSAQVTWPWRLELRTDEPYADRTAEVSLSADATCPASPATLPATPGRAAVLDAMSRVQPALHACLSGPRVVTVAVAVESSGRVSRLSLADVSERELACAVAAFSQVCFGAFTAQRLTLGLPFEVPPR